MSGWLTCVADILMAAAHQQHEPEPPAFTSLESSLQTSYKKQLQTWVWRWYVSVIPALERQKQDEGVQGQEGATQKPVSNNK